VGALVGLAAGLLTSGWPAEWLGRAGAAASDGGGSAALEIGGFLGLLLLALPVILSIHEAGHIVGGTLAGLRFQLFIVGPLRIARRGEGISVGLNRKASLYGGMAGCAPVDDRRVGPRMAAMVAGGPASSLLTGGLLLAAGLLLDPGPGARAGAGWGGLMPDALLLAGGMSLAIALVTLIPARTSGFLTDGARLLVLARGGDEAEREQAIWQIYARSLAGTRPRDWPEGAVADALRPEDGGVFEYVARSLAHARALDAGGCGEARPHLLRCLELWSEVPAVLRPNLAREAACFEASCRGDAARGRSWLDAAGGRGAFMDEMLEVRAEVAVERAAGTELPAAEVRERVEEARAGAVDRGMAAAQADWTLRLLEDRRP
jgi:hypothetical protein